jgi:hypothetical protein
MLCSGLKIQSQEHTARKDAHQQWRMAAQCLKIPQPEILTPSLAFLLPFCRIFVVKRVEMKYEMIEAHRTALVQVAIRSERQICTQTHDCRRHFISMSRLRFSSATIGLESRYIDNSTKLRIREKRFAS